MSPLMNRELNQVESPKLLWPAIQWSAASRSGATSGQPGAATGSMMGALTSVAGAWDAASAIPGTSAATTATAAVTSLYLFTGCPPWARRVRSEPLAQGGPAGQ